MDPEQTREFLCKGCRATPEGLVNRKTGRIVKAIMLVHLLGGMGDVDAFAKLADEFGLFLIEDAAECLGGGGAFFAHHERAAKRAKHLSTTAKADPIEFHHDELGYNYRMTNLSAAMGVGQLEVLGNYVDCKRSIASNYRAALRDTPGVLQVHPEPASCRSTFWMFTVRLDRPARPLVDVLGKCGIVARPLWRPIPGLPAMEGSVQWGRLPASIELCRSAISLPCSINLTTADQTRAANALKEVII